jgi:hypothetical protein
MNDTDGNDFTRNKPSRDEPAPYESAPNRPARCELAPDDVALGEAALDDVTLDDVTLGDVTLDDVAVEEELRAAVLRLDPVPPQLETDAMQAFALRTLDAELAEIAFDSWAEQAATRVRGAGAPRLLTFRAGTVEVELEVSGRRLLGRVVPAGETDVRVQRRDGERVVRTDALGRFTADALDPGPLRVRVAPRALGPVVTSWIRV